MRKKRNKLKRKAFTLIELLAVIIIIAVIALISIPIILNITEKVQKEAFKETVRSVYKEAGFREAEKQLDSKEPYCSVYSFSDNKESDYINEEELDQIFGKGEYDRNQKYKYDRVENLSLTGKIPTEGVISNCNGKHLGKLGNGKYTAVSDGENILITDEKLDKSLSLEETSGSLTYPGTKKVTINAITDGELSCRTSDENIATCSISGKTLTITAGTKAGTASITVESAETENYKKESVTYSATVASGILSVTANGYSGTYDGEAHGISVTSSGATIMYGIRPGVYDLTSSPTYTDVGTYYVYYQVSRPGYETVVGSKIVNIKFSETRISLEETSGSLTYPETKEVAIKGITDGIFICQSSNQSVATCSFANRKLIITSGTTAGTATIRVDVSATKNCAASSATYSVTVANGTLSVTANGYTGTYNGSAHGISVTSSGATIKYGTTSGTYNLTSSPTYTNAGTYTVYYQVTSEGYKTVTGNKNVVINKAAGSVTLSATSGTMPCQLLEPFSVTVTKNTSGGTLSCSTGSSTSIFTCSISGNKIELELTESWSGACVCEEKTITSAATTNYTTASAKYQVCSRGCNSC